MKRDWEHLLKFLGRKSNMSHTGVTFWYQVYIACMLFSASQTVLVTSDITYLKDIRVYRRLQLIKFTFMKQKKSINICIFYIMTNIFQNTFFYISVVNAIQDGPFRGCWGLGRKSSLPKIYHKWSPMMKLDTVIPYLNKIQNICKSHDTHYAFSIFSPEISNFWYIRTYKYRLYYNT